jgi:hypothetical protein
MGQLLNEGRCQRAWSRLACLGCLRYSSPSHTVPRWTAPSHLTISFTDSRFCFSWCQLSACFDDHHLRGFGATPIRFSDKYWLAFLEHNCLHPKHENLAGYVDPPRVDPHMGENGSKLCVAPMPL